MNIPGFDAEASLGPTMGIYRGKAVFGTFGKGETSLRLPLVGTMRPALARGLGGVTPVPQGAVSTIPVPLERYKQCTTVYSGYVAYPMTACTLRLRGGLQPEVSRPRRWRRCVGSDVRPLHASPVPATGQGWMKALPLVCTTRSGPWYAVVVREESCDFREPDRFKLTILGAPQSVELNWVGTLQDAPDIVGGLGTLSRTAETCSCCGSLIKCPDGSCVPPNVSCGQTTPV
jgi:hypothetical protein